MKKEFYKYYFNRDGIAEVTVCYMYDGVKIARGISIWNRKEDVFDTKTGEFYAKCNAERALKGRRIDAITKPEAVKSLIECDCPFTKKGELLTKNTLPFSEARTIFGNKKFMDFYKPYTNDLVVTIKVPAGCQTC